MITLSNGKKIDFLCASGALGFDGKGYIWDVPFRFLGLLDPSQFTIITKTLTLRPRLGNYRFWKPWETFRFIQDGIINLGLPNPGLYNWVADYIKYPQVIVSIAPRNRVEAITMVSFLSFYPNLIAIELNVSCPNILGKTNEQILEIVGASVAHSKHPIIVKLGIPYLDLCKELDGKVAAFDLINAVPWQKLYPNTKSPLIGNGAVSGRAICNLAREAIILVQRSCQTPIISGGGIDSLEEVKLRYILGARAFTFGTLFLKAPWKPNQIVKAFRKINHGYSRIRSS